jgi:hypothetical protein
MNFLFFIIFNMYYQDGNYINDRPPFTVFCQFVACISGLIWGFLDLFFWYYKDSCYDYASLIHIYIILMISGIITYFLFYHNKKYLIIYEKYKDSVIAKNLWIRIMAVLLMFCMLLFSLIIAYFKRKYDLCPLYS